MIVRKIVLALALCIIALSLNAGILQNYNRERIDLSFIQMPTETNMSSRNLMLKVMEGKPPTGKKSTSALEKAMLGVIKGIEKSNSKKAKSFLKQLNVSSTEVNTETVYNYEISPKIFDNRGEDLYAELYVDKQHVYESSMIGLSSKYRIKWSARMYLRVYNSKTKKLLYKTDNEYVLEQYKGKTPKVKKEENNLGQVGGNKYPIESLRAWSSLWAQNRITTAFGISKKCIPEMPIFYVKGLEGKLKEDNKKTYEDFQLCVESYSTIGLTEANKKTIKSCISIWNNTLKKHKKNNKKAEINDKNIWLIHYNLSVANALVFNTSKATKHYKKAWNLKWIKKSDNSIVDKYKKKSLKRTDIIMTPAEKNRQSYLLRLKDFVENFTKGYKKHKKITEMLSSHKNRTTMSETYLKYCYDKMLSKANVNNHLIYDFIPMGQFLETPKKVNLQKKIGSDNYSFTIKKRKALLNKIWMLPKSDYKLKTDAAPNDKKINSIFYSNNQVWTSKNHFITSIWRNKKSKTITNFLDLPYKIYGKCNNIGEFEHTAKLTLKGDVKISTYYSKLKSRTKVQSSKGIFRRFTNRIKDVITSIYDYDMIVSTLAFKISNNTINVNSITEKRNNAVRTLVHTIEDGKWLESVLHKHGIQKCEFISNLSKGCINKKVEFDVLKAYKYSVFKGQERWSYVNTVKLKNLGSAKITKLKYDKHGNIKGYKINDKANKLNKSLTFKYKYDKKNNWTERVSNNGDVTKRQFSY